ncbi:MAG: DUF1294 domain-containing protein [Bacteroidales bacterium]|nr:DUF1294 domain-containing protein [Bacteroidales bacterium]
MFVYFIIVNICAFIAFGYDKLKARRGVWRTPESTLLALAVLGGSMGAYLGMKIWRHKTHNRKFTIFVPLLICLQLVLIVVLYRN